MPDDDITLKDLNPDQQEIVQRFTGPLLVMATVGSGKTKVLAHRAAYAMDRGFDPRRMLALTFTNKAANEMRERMTDLIGEPALSMWISTFHSFCARVIRQEAKTLAISPAATVYDEEDCKDIVRAVLRSMQSNWLGGDERDILNVISVLKRQFILPYGTEFSKLDSDTQEFYRRYQDTLEANEALDFDDLITLTVRLFSIPGQTIQEWQGHFDWIEVDEIQDTTQLEYQIVSRLAEIHQNLALFGDVDQSIYTWRGAEPETVIARFRGDYPNAVEKSLSLNYRSTRTILQAALSLITASSAAQTRELETENAEGVPITLHQATDESSEDTFVANTIQDLVDNQGIYGYSSCAILSRTNRQASRVAQHLANARIPHLTVEEYEFFRRAEIKDAIAYLRLIAHPEDTFALKRVLLRPPRGIGAATISRLEEQGPTCGLALSDFTDKATFDAGDPLHPLLNQFSTSSLVCFDVETTGKDPISDEIVQIAAVKLDRGTVVDRFNRYVCPTKPVGSSVQIHGLTDDLLRGAGVPAKDAITQFIAFVDGSPVVGHNVLFDLGMLDAALTRLGIDTVAWTAFDTLQLSRRALQTERYSLAALAETLSLQTPTHRAEVDADVTAELLQWLITRLRETSSARRQLIALHGERFAPLASDLVRWRELATTNSLADLLKTILEESGYLRYIEQRESNPARRLANLTDLLRIIEQRRTALPRNPIHALAEFVRSASLSKNVDRLLEAGDVVAVVPIHQAKGLEFPVVFVTGVNDGSIPIYLSTGDEEKLEEERRLFYVALTRARERLYLSYPLRRPNWSRPNRPSRFLSDLPPDILVT